MRFNADYNGIDVDPTDGTVIVKSKEHDGYDRYIYRAMDVADPKAFLKELQAAVTKSSAIRKEKARKEIVHLTAKKVQLEKELKEAENDLKTLNRTSK